MHLSTAAKSDDNIRFNPLSQLTSGLIENLGFSIYDSRRTPASYRLVGEPKKRHGSSLRPHSGGVSPQGPERRRLVHPNPTRSTLKLECRSPRCVPCLLFQPMGRQNWGVLRHSREAGTCSSAINMPSQGRRRPRSKRATSRASRSTARLNRSSPPSDKMPPVVSPTCGTR